MVRFKKIISCQVLSKAEDKERVATIERSKVKEEESLEVAGGRCWKNIFLKSLKITGELFNELSMAGHFRSCHIM